MIKPTYNKFSYALYFLLILFLKLNESHVSVYLALLELEEIKKNSFINFFKFLY